MTTTQQEQAKGSPTNAFKMIPELLQRTMVIFLLLQMFKMIRIGCIMTYGVVYSD